MAASPRRSSGPVLRSQSPSGRLYSSNYNTSPFKSYSGGGSSSSAASAFASTTSSGFANRSGTLLHRSTSPSRVNLFSSTPSVPSVRFSLDQRPISPNRSISVSSNRNQAVSTKPTGQRRTCMCSPTTHPGSFRCALHKNSGRSNNNSSGSGSGSGGCYNSNRLQRSAMTNSLVRIGAVEGDLVRRALAALIRPSSHQVRRRENFQRRPSRLSSMSKAEDL